MPLVVGDGELEIAGEGHNRRGIVRLEPGDYLVRWTITGENPVTAVQSIRLDHVDTGGGGTYRSFMTAIANGERIPAVARSVEANAERAASGEQSIRVQETNLFCFDGHASGGAWTARLARMPAPKAVSSVGGVSVSGHGEHGPGGGSRTFLIDMPDIRVRWLVEPRTERASLGSFKLVSAHG